MSKKVIENNDNLKVNVSNIIKNIYNTKKYDALEISKTVLNNDLSTIVITKQKSTKNIFINLL